MLQVAWDLAFAVGDRLRVSSTPRRKVVRHLEASRERRASVDGAGRNVASPSHAIVVASTNRRTKGWPRAAQAVAKAQRAGFSIQHEHGRWGGRYLRRPIVCVWRGDHRDL